MSIMEDFKQRGLVQLATNEQAISDLIKDGKAVVYTGFDLTAPSLHVGHLITLRTLQRLSDAGNRVIVLLGTQTSLVGDPTGKNKTRPKLLTSQVTRFRSSIEAQIKTFCPGAEIMTNDWFEGMSFRNFMSMIANQMSVNTLIGLETMSRRLEAEEHLSLEELIYPAMQAFDFAHLAQNFGVNIQLGGSDQYGNICAGIGLARRAGLEVHGLCVPLLTTRDGRKMGKTEGGVVSLSPENTSDIEFFQFWRNLPDEDAITCAKLLLDVSLKAIADLSKKDINMMKRLFAIDMCCLRGADGTKIAETVEAMLSGSFDETTLEEIFIGIKEAGRSVDICAKIFSLSKSETRRLMANNGITLNGEIISESDLLGDGVLRIGKKRAVKLTVGDANLLEDTGPLIADTSKCA